MFLTGHHKLLSYPKSDREETSQNSVYVSLKQMDVLVHLFTGWIPAKQQEKTKKPRYIWLINPDEGLIRHSPHIKVWINEYCIIRARPSSSVAQIYFDIHWGETRRQTHLTGSEIHSGTQLMQISMWHLSATHGSREQLTSQNCQCLRAVPLHPWIPRIISMDVRCVCPAAGGQSPLPVPEVKLCHC